MVRLCAFALVLMTVDGACAQSWPSRPIRAIVPYTAGGAIDIVSRTVGRNVRAGENLPRCRRKAA